MTIFPPNRNTVKEVSEDGKDALSANLKKYDGVTRRRGPRQYSIKTVNTYKQKLHRLAVLEHNTALLNEMDKSTTALLKRIDEIKKLKEAQKIVSRLRHIPDVKQQVFDDFEKLLNQRGLATVLHDYIKRAAAQETHARQEQVDNVKTIVDQLDLPQKQRRIELLQRREAGLEAEVKRLELQLDESKDSYQDLNEQYLAAKFRLTTTSSASEEEVGGLRSERDNLKKTNDAHVDQIKELERARAEYEKQAEQATSTIEGRDALIKKHEQDIERERRERNKDKAKYDKLLTEYQTSLNKKAEQVGAEAGKDMQYQLEKQARQTLKEQYAELEEKYNEMADKLVEAEKHAKEVIRLKREKDVVMSQRNAHLDAFSERKKDLINLRTQVTTLENTRANLQSQTDDLKEELSNAKLEAQKELDANKQSTSNKIIELDTELTTTRKALEGVVTAATSDKAALRDDNRQLSTRISELTDDVSRLRAENTVLQKDLDTVTAKQRATEGELTTLKLTKDTTDKRVEDLEKVVDSFQRGKPAEEEALAAAKESAKRWERLWFSIRKDLEKAEGDLHHFNEVIVKYGFDGPQELTLDYKTLAKTLEDAPVIDIAMVRRAIQGLEPFVIGLPEHPPLTGFQLWTEALARPQEFTTMKVLAFLKGMEDGTTKGFGFLKLAITAILDGISPKGPLEKFVALAVLDMLDLWIHIFSLHTFAIRDIYNVFLLKRPIIGVSVFDSSLIERYVACVFEVVGDTIDPREGTSMSRGEKVLSAFGAGTYKILDLKLDESGSPVISTASTFRRAPTKLIALDTSPTYFIYVEKDRIVWLRPDNITIRIDVSRNVWFLHDNLQPHVLAEHEFSLGAANLSETFKILEGVTYLD